VAKTWDAWGHYHVIAGLITLARGNGDAAALASPERSRSLAQSSRPRGCVDIGSTEMNLAPITPLLLFNALVKRLS